MRGGDRLENAAIIRAVLAGESGPARDIVLVNSAAVLVTAGLAENFQAGMALARESVDSGRAQEKLARFIRFTNSFAVQT